DTRLDPKNAIVSGSGMGQAPCLMRGRGLVPTEDRHQFVDPMGAGMARTHGGQAVACELRGGLPIVDQGVEVALHLLSVACDQVIAPRAEEPFVVGPPGAG